MSRHLHLADDSQVLYQGKWIDKVHFRTFVYNNEGQKLANSYDEYSSLIESGLWFSTKEEVKTLNPINIKGRKQKNGADS